MLVLERFEENFAIIENNNQNFEVKKENISPDVREGDILIEKDGIYYADKEETEKYRKKITILQNRLWS